MYMLTLCMVFSSAQLSRTDFPAGHPPVIMASIKAVLLVVCLARVFLVGLGDDPSQDKRLEDLLRRFIEARSNPSSVQEKQLISRMVNKRHTANLVHIVGSLCLV